MLYVCRVNDNYHYITGRYLTQKFHLSLVLNLIFMEVKDVSISKFSITIIIMFLYLSLNLGGYFQVSLVVLLQKVM